MTAKDLQDLKRYDALRNIRDLAASLNRFSPHWKHEYTMASITSFHWLLNMKDTKDDYDG